MLLHRPENDIQSEDIKTITVHAGTNILKPIRYPIAANHLQAKLKDGETSVIVVARKIRLAMLKSKTKLDHVVKVLENAWVGTAQGA